MTQRLKPAIAILLGTLVATCFTQPIKHKFLYVDAARCSLYCVDQNNPSAFWAAGGFTTNGHDIQLVGSNRVMASNQTAYFEFNIATGEKVVTVRNVNITNIQSARRLPDGRTILWCADKKFHYIDSTGTILKTVQINDGGSYIRYFRITEQNTFIFGAGNALLETDTNGVILKSIPYGECYKVLRTHDGMLYAANGHQQTLSKMDSNGNVKKVFGTGSPGFNYGYIADFNILKNGHIVATNWYSNSIGGGQSGRGIVEWDTSGAVVWSYDSARYRIDSPHALIILDGLNTAVLNDERTGHVEPVGGIVGVTQRENAGSGGHDAVRGMQDLVRVGIGVAAPTGAWQDIARPGMFDMQGRRILVSTGTCPFAPRAIFLNR